MHKKVPPPTHAYRHTQTQTAKVLALRTGITERTKRNSNELPSRLVALALGTSALMTTGPLHAADIAMLAVRSKAGKFY